MELNDNSKKVSEIKIHDKDTSYVNTELSNATTECTKQANNEEGYYEQLRFDSKQDARNTSQQDTLKRIQVITYINLAMIIVLYVAAIGVIVVLVLPKDQDKDNKHTVRLVDGNWTQWSSWSFCDVTCGNGSQMRFRTCNKPPHTKGVLPCSGKATDVIICQMPPCSDTHLHTSNHVSFFAKMADENVKVGPNQQLVFNKVLNNNMNGYNSATGVFTAPLSGVYLFTYFIEVKNVYGKVDLRHERNLISSAVAYGRPTEIKFSVSGINNTMVFEATIPNKAGDSVYRSIDCTSGSFSVSGVHNSMNIQPVLDRCPYRNRFAATGGNTALIHVYEGENVWVQTSNDSTTLNIGTNGTSFTGILLFND